MRLWIESYKEEIESKITITILVQIYIHLYSTGSCSINRTVSLAQYINNKQKLVFV